jgi:hypothetical protein
MDDERLKQAGGGDYFEELLARIRDIRSSECLLWRKVAISIQRAWTMTANAIPVKVLANDFFFFFVFYNLCYNRRWWLHSLY